MASVRRADSIGQRSTFNESEEHAQSVREADSSLLKAQN
jgi:hypothetical protein